MWKILFFVLYSTFCFSQENIFDIEYPNSETNIPESVFTKKKSKPLYEDSKFLVTNSCSGEWGGSIFFTDKLTGKKYESSATCPIMVQKFHRKYIVTNILAHMEGCSYILEIENPKALKLCKEKKSKKIKFVSIANLESKSNQGTKMLANEFGKLALLSFQYNDEIYHIISDYKKTYICKAINGKFEIVQTLSDDPYYSYEPKIITRENNHYLVLFDDSKVKGYLEVSENHIKINKY